MIPVSLAFLVRKVAFYVPFSVRIKFSCSTLAGGSVFCLLCEFIKIGMFKMVAEESAANYGVVLLSFVLALNKLSLLWKSPTYSLECIWASLDVEFLLYGLKQITLCFLFLNFYNLMLANSPE